MQLKEILQKMVNDKAPVLLSDNHQDWEAISLLKSLSEPLLKRQVYLQPGMYIAEINDGGYLGRVLYKVKRKV
ncbi:MAG: hypothetical protein KAU46_10495 [Candidatus Aminicenantes bacterium]|nr:hypothetical protein [Candidatus Aminicenantes bacterium]